jgi:hypothetical protein
MAKETNVLLKLKQTREDKKRAVFVRETVLPSSLCWSKTDVLSVSLILAPE